MTKGLLTPHRCFYITLFVYLCSQFSFAQRQEVAENAFAEQHSVAIRGRVSDARTGEGIAKAMVSIRQQSLQTVTDERGRFDFPQVSPGEVQLYVSTVGYELLKSNIEVAGDHDVEADIRLGQQASKPSETVTVAAGPFDPVQPGVVSSNTLDNTELKNLATAIVDDPLRAVQTLPGVTTSDDYNAQFSLRGSGFSEIGVYVDGVLLSTPFHTTEDIEESGSVTVFPSDVVDSLELMSGDFPATYGEHAGAVLNITTRQGSQDRQFTSADIGMAGLVGSSEGPIGGSQKASWLVTARQSYIGTLLKEWGASYLTIGYSDFLGKLSFHPNSANQFTLGSILASGWFEPGTDEQSYSFIKKGESTTAAPYAAWNWEIGPSTLLHSEVSFVQTKAWNHDWQNQIPFESRAVDSSAQQEFRAQLPARHFITLGWGGRRGEENLRTNYYDLVYQNFLISAAYRRSAWFTSAYLQDNWQIIPGKLRLDLGGRVENFTSTGQNLWMPRASMALSLSRDNKLTFSWGRYGQFPGFRQLWGEVNNPALRAQRATHYIAGWERSVDDRTRIRVEAYEYLLGDGIWSPGLYWRLPRPLDLENGLVPVDGVLEPQLGPFLRNSLTGHSRGIEITLQRRSANRLSGWFSYSYGRSRASDPADQFWFWGDFDQRHTMNTYGSYRISKTIDLSAKYRLGTNFPLVGFYTTADANEPPFSEQPNQQRLPLYSRLDLRLSKAIYLEQRKLTFYTETINVLNRTNRGCQTDSIIQSVPPCDNEFPLLPSAGLALEF